MPPQHRRQRCKAGDVRRDDVEEPCPLRRTTWTRVLAPEVGSRSARRCATSSDSRLSASISISRNRAAHLCNVHSFASTSSCDVSLVGSLGRGGRVGAGLRSVDGLGSDNRDCRCLDWPAGDLAEREVVGWSLWRGVLRRSVGLGRLTWNGAREETRTPEEWDHLGRWSRWAFVGRLPRKKAAARNRFPRRLWRKTMTRSDERVVRMPRRTVSVNRPAISGRSLHHRADRAGVVLQIVRVRRIGVGLWEGY